MRTEVSLVDFLSWPTAAVLDAVQQGATAVQANAVPMWGNMTPQLMLEHLALVFKFCLKGVQDVPLRQVARPEMLETDAPIPMGVQLGQPLTPHYAHVDEARAALSGAAALFWASPPPQGPFSAHPAFGVMDYARWDRFHRKHTWHHYVQFGLLADPQQA